MVLLVGDALASYHNREMNKNEEYISSHWILFRH